MGELPNSRADLTVTSGEREEDAALARRAAAGDAEAFGVLYDRYMDAVYRYVFYRVRNEAEAEDVTSDVFMRALRAIPKYEPRQAFLAWLYRIARNAVIDRSRRRAARQQVTFEDALAHPNADQVINPDEGLLAGDPRAALRRGLRHQDDLEARRQARRDHPRDRVPGAQRPSRAHPLAGAALDERHASAS